MTLFVIMRISLLLVFLSFYTMAFSQRLERFAGKLDGRKIGYTHIKGYYGFIGADSIPDSTFGGKEFYFLYFQLDDTITDLGIRIVNPVPELCMPDKGDVVDDLYYEHEKEKSGRFNTWLSLERRTEGFWTAIASNDDGNEIPEGTNSVIRINTRKQPLHPGSYRIVISSSEPEKIKGGYLVQLGSYTSIKQIKFSNKQ